MTNTQDELLDLVDDSDKVIGVMERGDMSKENLPKILKRFYL